jgi:hypothetical protein
MFKIRVNFIKYYNKIFILIKIKLFLQTFDISPNKIFLMNKDNNTEKEKEGKINYNNDIKLKY